MKKRIRTSEYQVMDIRESEYQDYLLVVPDLLVSLFFGSWNLALGTCPACLQCSVPDESRSFTKGLDESGDYN